MNRIFARAAIAFAAFSPLTIAPSVPVFAQEAQGEAPLYVQTGDETPWIYRGSDVPRDQEWVFGEVPNGLRYAVRNNRVPPGQVSIRIRIDAGSIHERESEQGFAHLLEHLLFRESKYLSAGEAIPTWQRLGASFGSDTNAETSPTHTVYKLDLPNATSAALEESFKLLSGMIREPVLSDANVNAERPIVLAEKRDRGGAARRVAVGTRQTMFAGQRLANRLPIGTEATLNAANGRNVSAFYKRWYRPENAVIVAVGDVDPQRLAVLIETWFADWQGEGPAVPAPDFGDPVAPGDADGEWPVGETAVLVEPDLPRSLSYGVLRPWRQVQDTIVYNEGLLLDALSQAIINRRLESRARSGGSYLYAGVQQDDVSRSADGTFVTVVPQGEDWQAALNDVRGVISDALAEPPTQDEIDREAAEFDLAFASSVAERRVMQASDLADDIVNAVDIRETVAAPETVLEVFRGMSAKLVPAAVLERTQALFKGDVVRAVYVTPGAEEATALSLKSNLQSKVAPDATARLASRSVSFDDLPAIGEPGTVVQRGLLGVADIERVEFSNGATAILWANEAEPGRVAVKVRFGAGYRGFDAETAPYASIGESTLIGMGLADLGQDDLDRIATGRKFGFDFRIEDASFGLQAETRAEDLRDQLYLFAGKLAMPRWDANPFEREKSAAALAYESYATNPNGLLNRDLQYLLRNNDPRFANLPPAETAKLDLETFKSIWGPLLQQGPIEVLMMGDFKKDAAIAALAETIGALEPREPLSAEVIARGRSISAGGPDATVRFHRGDPNQAAAVIAWPTSGGVEKLRVSRQLEILVQLFNNRLLDEMRERAGASYAPNVGNSWPVELDDGGAIIASAQLQPGDVPLFFEVAEEIASDLALTPVGEDELNRVTEPLRQLISRASTGNQFWMYTLEGASRDPRRVAMVRSLLSDYSNTTPARMQELASQYLAANPGWRLAIIPEGQALATVSGGASGSAATGR